MASGGQPDGGKQPAKGAGGRGGGKSPPDRKGRKPRARGAAGKAPAGRGKLPSLPLLAAWILAVVILAALVYLGGGSQKPSQSHGPERTPVPAVAESPARAPGVNGVDRAHETSPAPGGHALNSEKARIPAGSVASPKPAFSSSDLPADPPPSKELLALNRPTPDVTVPKPPTAPVLARVAIIIDDFGPDIEIAKEFASLPFAVTFSVLPFQTHSADIARFAHSRGREVILHLPMEPHGYPKADPGRGALMVSMSEEAIKRGIGSALDTSPDFRGVNNHMGSKMTEDAKALRPVLQEINRRGLYFLDSVTSSKSKAWTVAREMKMPALKRDIFLDHNPSADSVRSQISRLIRIARVKGTALAIGHPHEATLKELRAASREFEKQGIKIVAASELIGTR